MTTTEQTKEQAMGLFEHIAELRQRLVRAMVAWIVGILVASAFADQLVTWLAQPLQGTPLIALDPTEAPITYFKIAIAAGFAVALPFIMYQVYGFIAPGLYPHERRIVLLGVPGVVVFFILGALFTLRVLIPVSLPVLMGFLDDVVEPTYSLERYLSFVSTLVVWMGLLFQTPLLIYVIARFGVVSLEQLKGARRIVWFLAAVFAAVVTPTTDPVTLLLVTGPFITLYELGLILARFAVRQREKAEKEREDLESV